jgi:hypothetical protein
MAKQYDTDIKEPEIVDAITNPLDEPVNEKRYTQPNVNSEGVDFSKPISEPSFAPPPMEKRNIESNEFHEKKREPINPEMKSIPKKETEMAAGHAAKLIIQGYEWAHLLANKGLQISEKRLIKLQAEGEINLNAMIDYDYGRKMRAGEFFQEYNQQVEGLLSVSEEFKEEVTPVLERVLAKRGIGMTDEQLLMFMFGKDIASKSLIFFQQKAQLNYMIESIKQATTSQYVQTAPPPPPPPPPTPQQSAPQQEQPQQPQQVFEETDVREPEESSFEQKKPRGKGRPSTKKK